MSHARDRKPWPGAPRPARVGASWPCLALAACLVLVSGAHADSLETTFKSANAAFARGQYREAIDGYQSLLDAHVDDPDLTFNLGLAHARLGEQGQAIRYFERTLWLAPRDEAARQALERARHDLAQKQATRTGEALVGSRPLLEAVFASFSASELAWACLIGSWLASLGLLALRRTRREAARLTVGIAIALATLLCGGGALGLGAKTDWGASGRRAVVLREGAELLEGPDPKAHVIDRLPEGALARIQGWEGHFALIEDKRGRRGAMRSRDIGGI